MRTLAIALLVCLPAMACSSASSSDGSNDPSPPSFGGAPTTTTGPGASGAGGVTPSGTTPADEPADPPGPPLDPNVDPATRGNPEELFLLQKGWDGSQWFCTATLIAKDVAITAGHCLDPSMFESFEVVAPTLASHPRVTASRAEIYDWNWEDVGHPDLGLVKLSQPIDLGAYAVLTDVTSKVDGAQALDVGAVVRTTQEPEAPFRAVGPFGLASATADGYPNSYGVKQFSAGGDSGAGMFLVENGKRTHKLVAIEHTPDPDRGLDHVSRVDATFIAWVQAKSAAP